MRKEFFVMLRRLEGDPLLLYDGDEERNPLENQGKPALFPTEQEAHDAAQANMLGRAYGYEVYPWRRRS